MRRPGWAARLAALVLAAVLAGGASERAEPARRGAPGGSALLYGGGAGHRLGDGARRFGLSHNGPEAVPMTEVFLLAAPKNDGKA